MSIPDTALVDQGIYHFPSSTTMIGASGRDSLKATCFEGRVAFFYWSEQGRKRQQQQQQQQQQQHHHDANLKDHQNVQLSSFFIVPWRQPSECLAHTLPETKVALENGWLEYEFTFGMAYFQGLC